ncbi:MAG: hypothetical protein Q9M14_08605 [Mariprofundaceae bacterium]|nr:hypothetical protein [Mariprofundaceae bacterium]
MGRIIIFCLSLSILSGCTVIAAVGGAAVDGALYVFTAEKKSLPFSMRKILVATQKTLDGMDLSATLIEPVDNGYILEFSNNKLSGSIKLIRETSRLTTVSGRSYKGMSRQKSVENAIFEGIQTKALRVKNYEKFNFKKYHYIRAKPTATSPKVGWFIPGTKLDVSPSKKAGWLKIKLPSGKRAFLKGHLNK